MEKSKVGGQLLAKPIEMATKQIEDSRDVVLRVASGTQKEIDAAPSCGERGEPRDHVIECRP